MAIIYNYHQMLSLQPQSYHHWRQSDCTSLTLNYYQHKLPFWQPTTHGLVSDEGQSGANAPSELPLYYWGIAQLYKLFGPSAAILRGLNSLLFLSGIFAFILALRRLSGAFWWSLLLGLLLFTSPILVFYGNNFLTNAPAFGMALWALASLSYFLDGGEKKHLLRFFIFCFLAGSFKLPGLFLLFTLGGLLFLKPRLLSPLKWKSYILGSALVLIPLAAWVVYADWYNGIHKTMYFSTTTFPLWDYHWHEIAYLAKEMFRSWWGEHFHPVTTLLFFSLGVVALFIRSPKSQVYRWLFVILSLGLLAYSALQYYTFLSHDYYTINMFMWVAVLMLLLSAGLKERFPGLMQKPLLNLGLLIFLVFNVSYATERVSFRYQDFPNTIRQERPELYHKVDSWLTAIGVGKNDSLIYIADDSHTPLYLMKRAGWTTHKMVFKDKDQEPLYFNRDSAQVARSVKNGADFLLVHGWQNLYERPYLHSFLRHYSGRYQQLFVFDLKRDSGFELPQRQLLWQRTYDFENADSLLPGSTAAEMHSPASGNWVQYGDGSEAYLAFIELPALAADQMLEARIWVKHNPEKKVLPVLASNEGGLAFAQSQDLIDETIDGWRQFRQKLVISEEVSKQGVRFFLWNPEHTEVYFDQLDIRLYARNPLQP